MLTILLALPLGGGGPNLTAQAKSRLILEDTLPSEVPNYNACRATSGQKVLFKDKSLILLFRVKFKGTFCFARHYLS